MTSLRFIVLHCTLGIALLIPVTGCKSTPTTPSEPRGESNRSAQRRVETVEDHAAEIRSAPDATTEAAALERFRDWAAGKGYTYVVRALRTNGPGEVPNPTGQTMPIRVEVAVYQAQRPIHTFSFIPRDNRNIGVIARG